VFHPELTGRENIYLNGAILGMRKTEIERKFDEIVAFAEVEKFIDTPVKHYSSGMYVRLAFAVAAHLEPEMLLVDEVLAVGDIQFQKKCLGKMKDVAKEGRTVLFVSHNMGAIQQLCNACILLEQGALIAKGMINQVIEDYLKRSSDGLQKDFIRKGNKKILFDDFFITDDNGNIRTDFLMGDTVCVHFSLVLNEEVNSPVIAIEIRNPLNDCFAHLINIDDNFFINKKLNNKESNKKIRVRVDIPQILFAPSRYSFSLWVGEDMNTTCDYLIGCMYIQLVQGNALNRLTPYPPHVKVFLKSKWRNITE
jgi:lipopolysaccharide transport system ATP-binding protein